jgi:hypothetical protein
MTMEIDLNATEYTWRDSARIKGVDATSAATVLKHIQTRDGSIQAQAVVDEARPKDNPIHPAFEWRDKLAAEEHRRWQARQLVRSIRRIDDPAPDAPPALKHVQVTSPAFFFAGHGNEDKPAGYYSSVTVLSDMDLFDRAMSDAMAKLNAAKRSVDELKQLAEKSENRDTLRALTIAVTALSTATAAIREMRH